MIDKLFLNLLVVLSFILSSSNLFSKEEIEIDNKVHADEYADFLENLALHQKKLV